MATGLHPTLYNISNHDNHSGHDSRDGQHTRRDTLSAAARLSGRAVSSVNVVVPSAGLRTVLIWSVRLRSDVSLFVRKMRSAVVLAAKCSWSVLGCFAGAPSTHHDALVGNVKPVVSPSSGLPPSTPPLPVLLPLLLLLPGAPVGTESANVTVLAAPLMVSVSAASATVVVAVLLCTTDFALRVEVVLRVPVLLLLLLWATASVAKARRDRGVDRSMVDAGVVSGSER
ncbi:uncharacterized protein LOC62_02G003249 [Vanrija pseudolonga]|uniref:Uncharacterized protein n=1 Tax=Vanrija pseudolonga TaxID=143232 RepID=A0AAF0Y877_9TREE|nr:hypothetical protein LOC62_02G003249 [Vanrija pseudolonga]